MTSKDHRRLSLHPPSIAEKNSEAGERLPATQSLQSNTVGLDVGFVYWTGKTGAGKVE